MIRLETERLILRNDTPEDVPAVHEYFSNEEVSRYEDFWPMTAEEVREMLSEWKDMDNRMAVVRHLTEDLRIKPWRGMASLFSFEYAIIIQTNGGSVMRFQNAYFIIGTAYAGKSTMVKLLAEKHGGIQCGENWHDSYPERLDPNEFPCLTYTRDLVDWHDFIRRTPEDYEAWYDGVSKECEILELRMLPTICGQGKPVFVDTNISVETLKSVAAPGQVLVMLADPELSMRRFFERPDADKQFLYRLILEEPDPEAAMENYREVLKRINSKERYDRFLHSGFSVIFRDEARSVGETLQLAEKAFGLC